MVLDAQGNATAVWDTWNGEDTVVESAYRPAGGSWQTPIDLSEEDEQAPLIAGEHDAQHARIAVDAQDDVTVVWERYKGVNDMVVQAVYRPAGGSWQKPIDLSEAGGVDEEPWIAVDAQGDATAVWKRKGAIQSAYRPAGGSWEVPVSVSGSGTEAFTPQAAVDAQGDATAVWMRYVGPKLVVQTAYRPAGGVWQTPTGLSAEGEEGGDPHIALDAHGDAMVVWEHYDGTNTVVRGSYRAAGGSWQEPTKVSGESEEAQTPQVALDAQGDGVVAWAGSTKVVGGYVRTRSAYRPAGGSWQKATDLSEDGGNAFPTDVAFDQEGNAVVVWERSIGSGNVVQAAYRPAAGSWQKSTNLSEEGRKSSDPVVVLDAEGEATAAQGDATVVWTSGEGNGCGELLKCVNPVAYTVQAAGYDAVAVPSEEFKAPATGIVGTAVAFSASPVDVWSPLLNFGDGTSTSSTSATHTYTSPGRYAVTFTSTEVLGYRTSLQRTVTIGPAAGTTGWSTGSASSSPRGTLTRPPAPAKSSALKLKLKLAKQALYAILKAKAIKAVCYVNAPGTCTVRGPAGIGRVTLTIAGHKTITIGLTHKALKELRHAHELTLTLSATASATDHRTATTTVTLLVR